MDTSSTVMPLLSTGITGMENGNGKWDGQLEWEKGSPRMEPEPAEPNQMEPEMDGTG